MDPHFEFQSFILGIQNHVSTFATIFYNASISKYNFQQDSTGNHLCRMSQTKLLELCYIPKKWQKLSWKDHWQKIWFYSYAYFLLEDSSFECIYCVHQAIHTAFDEWYTKSKL